MPAYTNITNGLVAVGAKPFATTMQALRDNPLAIAEGATGAPRVFGKALAQTFLGYRSVTGTGSLQWLNLDAMETLRIDVAVSNWSNGSALQLRYSNDNGGSWNSFQSVITNVAGTSVFGSGVIQTNLRTGASAGFIGSNPVQAGSATLTVPTNCNAIELRNTIGAAVEVRAMAWCLGGLEA